MKKIIMLIRNLIAFVFGFFGVAFLLTEGGSDFVGIAVYHNNSKVHPCQTL